MATPPRNYWMIAVGAEYLEALERKQHSVVGFGVAHRKRVQRMEPGDRIMVYARNVLAFAAALTVTERYSEDAHGGFPLEPGGEPYRLLVGTRRNVVLDPTQRLDARLIAPRMDYVRKWTPEWWPLAFQGLLHLIPKADFQMLEGEMRRARRISRAPYPFPSLQHAANDGVCALDRQAAEAY